MRKSAEIATAFANRDLLDGKTSFFLVGIGGAGMSALARMLKHRGYRVRGTDSTASPEIDRLRAEGFEVQIGHSGEGIQAEDAIILTDAIDLERSPEVARARELSLPLFRRSQALGWLLKPYKVIAVTGTHGKTTTTGMVGAALMEAGLDPTIVVGANVPQFGGPVVEGKGQWAVVEACEAYDSFHDLDPELVVLTNLELDHVDYHGNWENLKGSVGRFVRKLPESGWFIFSMEDSGSAELQSELQHRPADAFSAEGWEVASKSVGITTAFTGEHNRKNASAALNAATHAGADLQQAVRGIASFGGAERRLQVLLQDDITVIDDYAHHPTEIAASLQAIRERIQDENKGRLIVVFQPHLYSRTADNIPGFAESLSLADVVFITDIYPAREAPIPGVSSARIAEFIHKERYYVPSRYLLPMKVAAFAQPGDVVVGMGAGNISEFAPAFIQEWKRGRALQTGERRTKVAVLYGGDSSEREISILSGREILASLARQNYDAELVDVTAVLLSEGNLSRFLGSSRPDVALLALHGTHAEDGAIQGLLELLHIPYTGSGIQASALAMDKNLTKELLSKNGVQVPQGLLVTDVSQPIELPLSLIVKPNAEGSTVGLSFVESAENLRPAVQRALSFGGSCLVEEWIQGMEISVPVLGDKVLPPVEIAPASGRYDFASKYTPGATEEIVPARISQPLTERVQQIALQAHRLLRCEGATRTDMIIRNPDGTAEIFVLEVNTLPGMTQTSLLPNSARAAGIDFDSLTKWLVEDALRRHAAKA